MFILVFLHALNLNLDQTMKGCKEGRKITPAELGTTWKALVKDNIVLVWENGDAPRGVGAYHGGNEELVVAYMDDTWNSAGVKVVDALSVNWFSKRTYHIIVGGGESGTLHVVSFSH